MSVARAEALRAHGVTTVAVFSDSQAAIRRTAHLDGRPGQQLARAINEHAKALGAHGIEGAINWVTGHSMIPPVRTDPVCGRAQYGPVQPLGRTGPSPRLAVWDWTGLVWTSPHTLAISTLFLSQVPLKNMTHPHIYHRTPLDTHSG